MDLSKLRNQSLDRSSDPLIIAATDRYGRLQLDQIFISRNSIRNLEPNMESTKRRSPLLKYSIFLLSCLMLFSHIASASESREAQAPGRAMAQQAIKSKKLWRTTDHSKHEILQKDFKSAEELTQACISCHSEAEKQFHKTIHWTWLADPADKKREYGKAGNSLNNFCISTNKLDDASCLACHPG